MSLGPLRPRFKLDLAGTVDDEIARVETAVADPASRCVSRTLGNHVDITVVPEDRHFWSPCVHLDFRDSGDGVAVHGLIGPHPNVWTMFAFAYITIASATAFAVMLGLTQLWLDEHAWGLWIVPAGAVLCIAMYAFSQIGQRLAAEQTKLLSELVARALG